MKKGFRLNRSDKVTLFILFTGMPACVFILEKLKECFGFGDGICTFILWGMMYAVYVVKLVKSAMIQYRNLISRTDDGG